MATVQDELQSLVQDCYTALNNNDWDVYANQLSDDWRLFGDRATITAKSSFLAFIKTNRWTGTGFFIRDFQCKVSADNSLGVAFYTITFEGITEGKPISFSAIETMAFIKTEDGRWKIAHTHVSHKA